MRLIFFVLNSFITYICVYIYMTRILKIRISYVLYVYALIRECRIYKCNVPLNVYYVLIKRLWTKYVHK